MASKRTWDEARGRLAERFRLRTRDEWAARLESVDACVIPISLDELRQDELPDVSDTLGFS